MKKQNGFTLVEIMLASVIGIFLMAGVMNLFITTNKSVTLNDAVSQNQETGRFSMDYLTRFLRRSGYTEGLGTVPFIMLPYNANGIVITCAGLQAEACAENNPNGVRGDRISIPFLAGLNREVRSCTGTVLGGPANGEQLVANVFWVSDEESTRRELRCRTYDIRNNDWLDNAVSIIDNVEQMEFQVGVANLNNPKSKNAARYISIDSLDSSVLRFIRSFRLVLLSTSADSEDENKLKSSIEKRTYSLLDAPRFTIEDGNIRNIFSTTIELPNAIETAWMN